MRVKLTSNRAELKSEEWFQENKGKIFDVLQETQTGFTVDMAPINPNYAGMLGFLRKEEVEIVSNTPSYLPYLIIDWMDWIIAISMGLVLGTFFYFTGIGHVLRIQTIWTFTMSIIISTLYRLVYNFIAKKLNRKPS